MRRIIIQGLLSCLLALFPGLTLAQTLTGYEYWFDDDFAERQTGTLSGTIDLVNVNVDARRLPHGVHTLNIRARQSDGMYSAVSSSTFIKISAGLGNKLEYWIDDDISKAVMIEGSQDADGSYEFITSLDMRAVSPGLHRLNMRPRSSSGKTAGAITTADFIKISTGVADKLEYWIDDDRSTVQVIEGALASDGKDYIFVKELDLGDVTPGYHRLYYRAISSTDLTASAVSMTPIIVKSRYYHDDSTATVVKKYSVVVDDEAEMVYNLPHPKDDYEFNYIFDARYLSKGKHKVKASFWNSFGFSTYAEQEFTVKEPEEPKITLSASEKDGVVSLTYDYKVPNNVKHRVLRVYENGTKTKVFDEDESVSDGIYTVTDAPPAGQSVYHVLSQYQKYDGSYKNVLSNEVTVNVSKSQDDLSKYGYIIGYVPQSNALLKYVVYSDGKQDLVNGEHFRREMIEVGKQLTIEVHESQTLTDNYYEPVTLTVHEGENSVSIKQLTGDDRPDDFINHLAFASDLEWVGSEFKFKVTNISRNKWTGRVRFRAISKTQDALPDDSGSLNPGGDAGTQAGAVAPMPGVTVEKNYYYSYSEPISIWPGGTEDVTLSLQGVFPDDKKEYYVFYIESEGQWRDGVDAGDEIRLLAVDESYNIDKNPFVRLIDKSDLEYAEDAVLRQDAEYAANLILMVTGYIKSFDGILGKTKAVCDYIKDVSVANHYISDSEYDALLENALNSETFDGFLNSKVVQEAPVAVLADIGSEISQKLRDDIVHDILKYGKDINKYLGKAMKLLKEVKQFQEENTFERTFHCADKILDLAVKDYPLLNIVKPYIEVGKSMIAKALEYGEAYSAPYQGQDIYDKKIEFKIKVETNIPFVDFNFGYHGTSAIREVKVMLANRDDWDRTMVDTVYFEPEGVWDGVMLRQTRYSGVNPSTGRGNIEENKPLQRIWMEIKWKNGRTSRIPLLGKNEEEGVNYTSLPNKRYTVHFHSGTTKYENIADVIHLTNHKTL